MPFLLIWANSEYLKFKQNKAISLPWKQTMYINNSSGNCYRVDIGVDIENRRNDLFPKRMQLIRSAT